MTHHLTFAFVIALLATPAWARQHTMPPGMSHDEHLKQMQKDDALKARGALAMGFDQDKTEHHFLLQPAGGAIVVTARDAADAESIAQVRAHLREIASAFAEGAFDKPAATHDEMPPGAKTMAENRGRIVYRYEERDRGGAVVIATSDRDTLAAIHQFLRYQITEHKTGDPLQPQP